MSAPPSPWRRVAYWGWLRFALGVGQMSCAAYAVFLLFSLGLEPVTWGFILAAFGFTAISRLLYRGKPDPDVGQSPPSGSN